MAFCRGAASRARHSVLFQIFSGLVLAGVCAGWLVDTHRKLDEAVFAAYGWPSTLNDAELLERLLALKHERVAAQ
jgi:hypothetical protein